jgi:hypothetical protein
MRPTWVGLSRVNILDLRRNYDLYSGLFWNGAIAQLNIIK